MLLRWFNYLALAGALAIFISYQLSVIDKPLTWDEIDYSNVAGKGIKHNALEENSLTLKQFMQLARAKAGSTTIDTTALKNVDEMSDPFRLRHYHSTFPVYYWALYHNEDPDVNDARLKWSHIILGIALLAMLIIIFRKHLGNSRNFSLFTLGIVLLYCSDLFLESFTMLHYHIFFLIAVIVYTAALNRYTESPSRRNAVVLGATIALLFVTLETAPFVLFSTLAAVLMLRLYKQFTWKHLFIIVLSSILVTFILWPGGIIKGSLLKSWAVYIYRIFYQANEEYSRVNYLAMWSSIIKDNIFLFTAIPLAVILQIRKLRNNPSFWLPFLNGLMYAVFMTPFIINRTYILPAIGLLILSVISLSMSKEKYRMHERSAIAPVGSAAAFGLLIYFALTIDWSSLQKEAAAEKQKLMIEIAAIQKVSEPGKPAFIDGSHVITYYLPSYRDKAVNMELKSYTEPGFYERVNYQYVNRDDQVKNREYGVIVIRKEFALEQADRLRQLGYKEMVLDKYAIFY